jgi:hypothetical protein
MGLNSSVCYSRIDDLLVSSETGWYSVKSYDELVERYQDQGLSEVESVRKAFLMIRPDQRGSLVPQYRYAVLLEKFQLNTVKIQDCHRLLFDTLKSCAQQTQLLGYRVGARVYKLDKLIPLINERFPIFNCMSLIPLDWKNLDKYEDKYFSPESVLNIVTTTNMVSFLARMKSEDLTGPFFVELFRKIHDRLKLINTESTSKSHSCRNILTDLIKCFNYVRDWELVRPVVENIDDEFKKYMLIKERIPTVLQ